MIKYLIQKWNRSNFKQKVGLLCCLLVVGLFLASTLIAQKASAEEKSISKDATYVGTETCASCHEKEYREYKLSTHARIELKDAQEGVAQGCEMCHGPGSIHADAGGGRGTMINPRKNPEVCFSCHMDKKMEFQLRYHHPVLEGHMSCSDCHSAHGVDARPWTATSVQDVNEACFKCHKDKRGPFVWDHDALRDGCVACHKVHGSINDKMLVARDANLCLKCHISTNFPRVGNSNHASRNVQGTCWSAGCHYGIHGSNFDRHLRE